MTFNKVNMFKSCFLVMKILAVISAIITLKFQSSLIFSSLSLFMLGIQFIALVKAEKLIEERNYIGIIIGLVVSVLYLGSIMLPLGIWGLYSLLNQEFMSEYKPHNAPAWFSQLRSK